MKDANFLRRKNLVRGVMAATLATGMVGQAAMAAGVDYDNLLARSNVSAIGAGVLDLTKINVKDNLLYAKAGEGKVVEWVRVGYLKNGYTEMSVGAVTNLAIYSGDLTESTLHSLGYDEMGIWTAYQAKGDWNTKLSTYQDDYEFNTEEKPLAYISGTAKLDEIDEKKLYFTIRGREEEKVHYWVGEIDYSKCYKDKCVLDTEKSTALVKVFTGGTEPGGGGEEGTGVGSGSGGSGGTGGTEGTEDLEEEPGEGEKPVTPGGAGGGGETPVTPGLPTTNPTDKDSDLNLGDKEEDKATEVDKNKVDEDKIIGGELDLMDKEEDEEEFEDESEEGEGEEEKEDFAEEPSVVKKPSATSVAKPSTTVAIGAYGGVLSTSGNAVSEASEVDSSDDDDEMDMDSDLGLDTAYEASDGLETPILGEGTGQKKGFSGWAWAAIAGLVAMGVAVVGWWFWPTGANKGCKEDENGV